MGLIGTVLKIAGLLVLAVIGLGAFLYFTDYAAEGTVTQTGRDTEGDFVVIRPKLAPYDIKQHLDSTSAQFVCEGYGVTYRLQSGHYQVRDRQGALVYDSTDGLTDPIGAIRCSALG